MPGITSHSSGLQVQRYVCRGCGEDCAVAVEAQTDAVCACARCGAAPEHGERRSRRQAAAVAFAPDSQTCRTAMQQP